MKQEKKPQQPKSTPRATHKTKEDFMRWWHEQDARKKKEAKNNNE
jgi:hypothetical protein